MTYSLPGYSLFRRDRVKRKGGGVAIYVRNDLHATESSVCEIKRDIELLWVSFEYGTRRCYIGALYHPPAPIYKMDDLRDAIERTLEGIFNQSGDSLVVLGGDFNKLQDEYFLSLGLLVEFNDATHAGHSLDRIYVSEHVYSSCYAFDAIVKNFSQGRCGQS